MEAQPMIRMKKGAAEGNAAVVAACEGEEAWVKDKGDKTVLAAEYGIAIALAWADGADEWNGWKFIREEVKW